MRLVSDVPAGAAGKQGGLRSAPAAKRGLDGAEGASSRWAQVTDVNIVRAVTEWALPGLCCPGCRTATFAEPPPGAHQGAVSYGPVLTAAAVLLSCYGNVLAERAAQVGGTR